MATILRVKRRLEDSPQDALVLLCKRLKTVDSEADNVSPALFMFRGTVDNTETSQVKTYVPKEDTKFKGPHNVNEIIQKIRKEKKEVASENRYEIVNCSRGVKDSTDDDIFDLVDLQQKKSDLTDEVEYAYDLYTSAKQDFDISMLDDLVSIENYETNLIFGSYRDNGQRTPTSSIGEESDDSNDENNWRNDYPDSEHSSINEEDMIKAVQRCDIEDDLSSDEGEDKIYEDPQDAFHDDVQRFGEAYAKYKARVLSEDPSISNGSLLHSLKPARIKELDQEVEDGYKDDSDDGFYYGQEEDSEQFKDQYTLEESDGPD